MRRVVITVKLNSAQKRKDYQFVPGINIKRHLVERRQEEDKDKVRGEKILSLCDRR